jgi:hypothetical protein
MRGWTETILLGWLPIVLAVALVIIGSVTLNVVTVLVGTTLLLLWAGIMLGRY